MRLGLQVTMRGQDGPIGRMTEKMELLVREFQDRVVAENAGIDVGRKNSGEGSALGLNESREVVEVHNRVFVECGCSSDDSSEAGTVLLAAELIRVIAPQ